MSKQSKWWRVEDVQKYMRFKSLAAAKQFMYRKKVRRCTEDRRFTTQAWVDEALEKK